MFLASSTGVIAGVVLSALLVAVARADVRARRIPNRLVLVLVVLGVAASMIVSRETVGLTGAVSGFAVGLLMWLPFWLLHVLGAGDVKLAAAVGAWLGPIGVIQASALAAVAGGVLALAVLARRRRLAPLVTGFALWTAALRRGECARPLASDQIEVLPYGVALAVGAALVAWVPAAWRAL